MSPVLAITIAATIAALLVVVPVFLVLLLKKKISLTEKLGKFEWANPGIASIVGVVGGLLVAVLTLTSPLQFSYWAASVFFSSCVVFFAPVVYGIVGRWLTPHNLSGSTSKRYQGIVIGFLVFALLILVGAFGQVFLLIYVLLITQQSVLSIFAFVLIIFTIVFAVEMGFDVYWTVIGQLENKAYSRKMLHGEMLADDPSLTLREEDMHINLPSIHSL